MKTLFFSPLTCRRLGRMFLMDSPADGDVWFVLHTIPQIDMGTVGKPEKESEPRRGHGPEARRSAEGNEEKPILLDIVECKQ